MHGVVEDGRDAQLSITVVSSNGDQIEISALVDTGFTSELTLPTSIIQQLELNLLGHAEGILADGSIIEFGIYRGKVFWQDEWIQIDIHETAGTALVGMQLMKNCRLTMDIVSDGEFTIVPLETTKE